MSIWDISHPPKTSPLEFVSAGIATARMTNSPLGSEAVAVAGSGMILADAIRRRGASRRCCGSNLDLREAFNRMDTGAAAPHFGR